MIVLVQFVFNLVISAIVFALFNATLSPWLYLVIGLTVATILARKQFAYHCQVMKWKFTYVLIWVYDIVLWPASIVINLRQAYAGTAGRDNT
jgi:hypothetical protein